jgi:hypothetical protein
MTLAGPQKSVSRLAAMPARAKFSLLSCALALAFGGCGSGDGGTIPQDTSEDMLSLLAATEEAVSQGECDRAQEHAQNFVEETESLPGDVDPEVAEELTTAASNLENLASNPEQCTGTGPTGETGATTAPETTTTTTTEPEVETTTDETTTSDEEEEPTTTIEEEPPEDEPAEEEPPAEPPAEPPSGTPGGGQGGGLEPPSGGVGAGGGAG